MSETEKQCHNADITISRHQTDWLHRKVLKTGNPEDWDRFITVLQL